jgi:hypothetical protein
VIQKIASETLSGVNPRNHGVFLNEVGDMILTKNNLLITGESRRIRMWDMRQSINHFAQDYPVEAKVTNRSMKFSKKLIKSHEVITNAKKMTINEGKGILIARFSGASGITTFDMRRTRMMDYFPYHYYPCSDF